MKRIPVVLMSLVSTCVLFLTPAKADTDYVQIQDMGTYYSVTIDYTSATPTEIGTELGAEIASGESDFQSSIDSYIDEIIPDAYYAVILSRVGDIKSQVPSDFVSEVNAMALSMGLGYTNIKGDGLLSRDELWMVNLFPEVARNSECSALAVYGSKSANGNTQVMRLLDWNVGSSYQLARIQAVETATLPGGKQVVNIGFLGYRAMLTGYNSDGIFAAQLDSGTGADYSSSGKRSYSFDLRYALENQSTLTAVSNYLSSWTNIYPFNHLIFLADTTSAAVLENNFSGDGDDMNRALRVDDSTLNPGITWGFTDAVGAVNSFLLEGNHDNHTGSSANTARWSSLKTELTSAGTDVTWEELKAIASFDNNNGPGFMNTGDLYSNSNVMIVIFQPYTGKLEIAFHPRNTGLPSDPTFISIFEGKNSAAIIPAFILLLQ